MPNSVKYNTSTETLSLKKGNFWIGTGDVGKGPTSTTGFYNGITPPSGGYTIYVNKATGGPSIMVANNDASLIAITNSIAGASYTTVNQCFSYFAGQSDKMVVQRDYEGIVTNGLVLNLDSGYLPSYPQNGTSWYDLGPSGNTGTLTNGPTFNSGNGGSIVFDGTNDYVGLGTPTNLNITGNITINSWVNLTAFPSFIGTIYEKGYDNNNDQLFFRFRNNSGTQVLDVGTYKGSNNTNYMTTYTIGSSITTGIWNNIVGQYDGASWNIYLNGNLVSSTLQNQAPLPSTSPVSIGAAFISTGYERFINGTISAVQVYNRALTASEVLQNYNAQKSRFGL